MENLLIGCPKSLKSAFHATLSATVSTLSAPSLADIDDGAVENAVDLFTTSQKEFAAGQSYSHDLVCIQIMILLAVEVEARGPIVLGPSYTQWLCRAIESANSARLNVYQKAHVDNASYDYDPDPGLVRRVWWTLVTMDRWHASSKSIYPTIPDEAAALYTEEPEFLSDHLYHLARTSLYFHS